MNKWSRCIDQFFLAENRLPPLTRLFLVVAIAFVAALAGDLVNIAGYTVGLFVR
jgi:hypothetical protein